MPQRDHHQVVAKTADLFPPLHPDVGELLQRLADLSGQALIVYCDPDLPDNMWGASESSSIAGTPCKIAYSPQLGPHRDCIIAGAAARLVRLCLTPEAERLFPEARLPDIFLECERPFEGQSLVLGWIAAFGQRIAVDMISVVLAESAEPGAFLPYFKQGVGNLAGLLMSIPLAMRDASWLYRSLPRFRSMEMRSLVWMAEDEISALDDPLQARLALIAPNIYQMQMALRAAQAAQVADLCGRPDLLAPYAERGYGAGGQHLMRLVLAVEAKDWRGDIAAIDTCIRELGLRGFITWIQGPRFARPDRGE